jgi:hypothetical protein
MLGIAADSIEEFESPKSILQTSSESLGATLTSEPAEADVFDRALLEQTLKANNYCIEGSANQLKITIHQLARSALKQGIRIPLNARYGITSDPAKLEKISTSLSHGQPLKTTMKTFCIGGWALTRILLNSPQLYRKHSIERKIITLRAHRRTLTEAVAKNPAITREEFRKEHSAACEYLREHDPQFWNEQIRRAIGRWVAPPNADEKMDGDLAGRISKALDELRAITPPVWLTCCRLLKQAGIHNSLLARLDRYPLTRSLIDKSRECRRDFLVRKIGWAVAKMALDAEPISVNKLRRVAGVPGKLLNSHAQIVTEAAEKNGARIHSMSFFARDVASPIRQSRSTITSSLSTTPASCSAAGTTPTATGRR